jgi:hypothetical protein
MAGAREVLTKSRIKEARCPAGVSQSVLSDLTVPGLVVRVLPGGPLLDESKGRGIGGLIAPARRARLRSDSSRPCRSLR